MPTTVVLVVGSPRLGVCHTTCSKRTDPKLLQEPAKLYDCKASGGTVGDKF